MNEKTGNNVISFPKERIVNPLNVYNDGFQRKVVDNKTEYTDYLVQDIFLQIANRVSSEIDVENENFIKDFYLVVESLRSLFYRQYGMTHPIQKLIDEKLEEYILENKEHASAPFKLYQDTYKRNENGIMEKQPDIVYNEEE